MEGFGLTASEKYKELNENSPEYKKICDEHLREYVVRREAFTKIRLFLIADNDTNSKFVLLTYKKSESRYGVRVVTLFHGPNFQEDKCQFDFNRNMCTGHENDLMCFTENALYSWCNQDKRNKDTSIGYIILCKVILSAIKIRDPEDTAPLYNYFLQGYDSISDYGNRKIFKVMSNEVMPYCLIQYQRKYNYRLDNPIYEVFEAQSIDPSPEVRYEEITSIEFSNLSSNLTYGKILSVKKIINPYLEQKYLSVKEQYYPNAAELQVCHGTTFECAHFIAKYNLDWRKCCYGKYGWGVHFALFANYATYFPLNNNKVTLPGDTEEPKKCMIIFDMLYDEKLYPIDMEEVNEKLSGMVQPPEGYNGVNVHFGKYVKFNDNEFLPKYIIIYKKNKDFNLNNR